MRPRHHAHAGSVVATGFAIDPAVAGLDEARQRVLALWTPGATVVEHRGLWIVAGLVARRVRTAEAPGAPLVAAHGVVATAPLTAEEVSALGGRGVVVVRDGVAEVVPADAPVLDVAAWVDLAPFERAAVEALAPPPAVAAAPEPETATARELAGVAPAAEGAEELREAIARALRGEAPSASDGDGGAAPAASPGRPSLWQRIRARLASRRGEVEAAPVRGRPTNALAPAVLPPRGWWGRLGDRLRIAVLRSRLGDALGRRQAAYLRRMLEMFDRGDLDEALRHAIPIGGGDGGASPALGVPQPRDQARLSMSPRTARGTAIGVGEDAEAMIRARYRAALARLEQQGRIEDAAFVLADLLHDVPGAVALLERHGKHAIAARLAEGHRLEPGLVVRLWFLAGDAARAIAIARRDRAWADAIARLEKSGDARAAQLRLAWADHLADAGDFAQAVDVVAHIPEARELVLAWIDRGIAGEGHAAARLLVRKLVLAPETFADVAPAVLEVLDDDEPDGMWRRVALTQQLLASPTTAEVQAIARPTVRALLRDVGRGADGETPALLPRLLRFADDPALRADQPVLARAAPRPSLVDRDEPLELRWSRADAGALPIHDAALLPGGRVVVALGELGVRILARDGRTVAHLDQPATHLVLSDHGTRALAAARRGDAWRIARLDLVERRAAHWCDAELDSFADTYDGDLWMVARGGELLAIDCAAPRWRATWGVATGLGDNVTLRREGDQLSVAPYNWSHGDAWFYERLTLRARKPFTPRVSGDAAAVYQFVARPSQRDWIEVSNLSRREPPSLRGDRWDVVLPDELPGAVVVENRVVALASRSAVTLVHTTTPKVFARLVLDGATQIAARLADFTLTTADDRGRVAVLDLRTGTLLRDLRVS